MEKSQSSLKTQFMLMMIGAAFVTMFIVGVMFTVDMIESNEVEVQEFRETLTEDVKRELKNQTKTALSVIETIYKDQQAGRLTEEQAKTAAANLVRNMRYEGEAGYFWIDTYEGINVVLLGRAETEGRSRINQTDPTGKEFIREMIENGQKSGGGFTELMFAKPNQSEPLPKINYTESFAPYRWVVGTGVWIDYIDSRVALTKERADANLHRIIIKMTVLSIVLAVVIVFVANFLANQMIIPIRNLTSALGILGTGDFRLNNPDEHIDIDRTDELGVMARAVVNLRKNVHEMIGKVITSAEQVAAASQQLTASADQSTTAINQVAESIVSVAGACTEQFTEVENATAKAEELREHMKSFTATLEESLNQITETDVATDRGVAAVKYAIDQMQTIEFSVNSSAEVIAQLGEESGKIGKIVDAISNIADQTNLLALNAAIEAARAGEHGRGFAVVADEVRKLAEQSQSSAKEISTLIGSIQNKSQEAVVSMQKGVQNVKTGADVVNQAGNTFGEIMMKINELSERSETMNKLVMELSKSANVIINSVDKINEKSREVASESETVSAAGEEQSATMHEIADASRSLAEMAQQMQDVIAKFKI